MLFTVNERSLRVLLKKQRHYGHINKQMEDLLLRNLMFQISSDFVTFETNFRDILRIFNNFSCTFFCGQNNLPGGQFWVMGKFNSLGGQSNLLGGQMPTQLTCYLPPCFCLF